MNFHAWLLVDAGLQKREKTTLRGDGRGTSIHHMCCVFCVMLCCVWGWGGDSNTFGWPPASSSSDICFLLLKTTARRWLSCVMRIGAKMWCNMWRCDVAHWMRWIEIRCWTAPVAPRGCRREDGRCKPTNKINVLVQKLNWKLEVNAICTIRRAG